MNSQSFQDKSNRSDSVTEQKIIDLCKWIDEHIAEPIGWSELMNVSGLDHLSIQASFFKYKAMTPMTWIRKRRLESKAPNSTPLPIDFVLRSELQGIYQKLGAAHRDNQVLQSRP